MEMLCCVRVQQDGKSSLLQNTISALLQQAMMTWCFGIWGIKNRKHIDNFMNNQHSVLQIRKPAMSLITDFDHPPPPSPPPPDSPLTILCTWAKTYEQFEEHRETVQKIRMQRSCICLGAFKLFQGDFFSGHLILPLPLKGGDNAAISTGAKTPPTHTSGRDCKQTLGTYFIM